MDFIPIYYKLSEQIRGDIESGRIKVNEQLPCEEDLAKQLKVSKVTIRSTLKKLEAEGYIFRIKSKGTFATLPEKRSRRIIIVCEEISWKNRNLHSTMAGIITRAQSEDVRVQVSGKKELPEIIAGIRNNTQYQSGIIFMHNYNFEPEQFSEIDKLNVPWLLEGGEHVAGCSYVDIDNKSSMEKVVDHLSGLGHRNFAIIAIDVKNNCHIRQRLEATVARIRETCGAFDEKRIFMVDELDVPARIDAVCGELLKLNPRPTAIICPSDFVAVETLFAMQARGIKVPDEISITGFDDVMEYNQIIRPKLTTIRQDYFENGVTAAETLIGMMKDYRNGRVQIRRELDLVIRETTGRAVR